MNDTILLCADQHDGFCVLPAGCEYEAISAADRIRAEQAMTSLEVPVMRRTARRLKRLREECDDVDAHDLTEVILDDSLMTMRLLADAANAGAATPKIESVTAALVMIGIEPFFARHATPPIAEDWLESHPAALLEYQRLNRVSCRAARLAGALSGAANDPDVPVIYLAALLHAAARLMISVHEPSLAVRLRHMPCRPDIAAGLIAGRHLPPHLIALVGGNPERMDPQMERVRLAVGIARALESGWSNPELADLLSDLGRHLGLSVTRTRELVDSVRV